MLPKAIQEAKNRQQLSSLALLGQGWFELTIILFFFEDISIVIYLYRILEVSYGQFKVLTIIGYIAK